MNEQEAVQEAQAFLSVIKDMQFEYPVYYDMENASQFKLGKKAVSRIIRAFLSTVEAAGYWVGLYMSVYWLNSFVEEDIYSRYAVWVAKYGTKCTFKGPFGMWQHSQSRKRTV